MPELKNYRLLISHSWKYSTQYDTILEWLNTASNFKWSNHSVSADNPFNTKTKTALKEQLTQQIRGCNAIIVVSGMYTLYSEWIDYEINEASEEQNIDSPLYTYLPNIVPPNISDRELDELLDTAKTKEETISNLVGKAEALKNESKFKESISEWKKLRDILPNNDYVVQQLALVQYKSKYPNATLALGEALNTIQSLNPKKSLDLETIGITGAIYKNLFKLNKNYDYLDEAINYYKKGFIIKNDYYNGENYSNCLLLKTQKPDLEVDEIEYLKFESKKVCREIISLLEENIRDNEINYWMYATLATCYLCLKDEKNYQKYEAEFLANTTIEWEIETYKNTIADTKKILMIE